MSKKDLLKTLDNASYVSLITASVLVLAFEFSAILILIKLSVILYATSFLILTVLCIMKIVFAKKNIFENEQPVVDTSKESLFWIFIRLFISLVLFVLAVILFTKL